MSGTLPGTFVVFINEQNEDPALSAPAFWPFSVLGHNQTEILPLATPTPLGLLKASPVSAFMLWHRQQPTAPQHLSTEGMAAPVPSCWAALI